MQGLRAQIDRDQYKINMQEEIHSIKDLSICEDSAEDLQLEMSSQGEPAVASTCLGDHPLNHSVPISRVV